MYVLVNDSLTEEFPMKKGLRQGDPMASFLFLIIAERLNGMLKQAVTKIDYSGFRFDNGRGEEVSILQFVDDTIFLGEATMKNVLTIKSTLRCFELASGLMVNFHKSKIAGVA